MDSFVLPAVLSANCQPTVKIGDVIEDSYELRNLTAHGLPIPKDPFREKYELLSTDGQHLTYSDYYYTEACDQLRWKAEMTVFEHRFKNSGGMVVSQRR